VKAASRSNGPFESSGSLRTEGQPDALRSREPSVAETNQRFLSERLFRLSLQAYYSHKIVNFL
jgi:hypothetical protein